MSKPSNFGEQLRYYRERAKLTQHSLIMKLARLGSDYSLSTISMWETEHRLPSDSAVFAFLGDVLQLTEDEESALVSACLDKHDEKYLKAYTERKAGREVSLLPTSDS